MVFSGVGIASCGIEGRLLEMGKKGLGRARVVICGRGEVVLVWCGDREMDVWVLFFGFFVIGAFYV